MPNPAPQSTAGVVDARRCAATCRWATPTIFLDSPFWLESERTPWSCTRDPIPRALTTTDECAVCDRWEAAPIAPLRGRAELAEADWRPAEIRPLMIDWFGALPPPHEIVRSAPLDSSV